MENSTTSKMVTFKSSNGVLSKVPEAVAMQSQVIRHLIEGGCAKDPIPLLSVSENILAKMIEFCEHQIDVDEVSKTVTNMLASSEQGNRKKKLESSNRKKNQSKLSDWEQQFFDVDQDTIFDLVMAADYLCIDKLLESVCKKVADMMSAKTVEEIRKTFHIINDFTPEEEQEIRCKCQWAFE